MAARYFYWPRLSEGSRGEKKRREKNARRCEEKIAGRLASQSGDSFSALISRGMSGFPTRGARTGRVFFFCGLADNHRVDQMPLRFHLFAVKTGGLFLPEPRDLVIPKRILKFVR